MPLVRAIALAIGAAVMTLAAPHAASAACLPVKTVQDLDNVRSNLAGQYCLVNDIDLASVANFVPIGSDLRPFTGQFVGGNHVIRNLTIGSGKPLVGLFGQIVGGRVVNLTLAGVKIRSNWTSALVGAVAGQAFGATIINVRVTGSVSCAGGGCRAGALVGEAETAVLISRASATASVTSADGGASGGLVGQSSGTIALSDATGPVVCGSNCAAGGLVGQAGPASNIVASFAAGSVQCQHDGNAGGLVGTNDGSISRSYATGGVHVGANELVAGLVGYHGGKAAETFAVGNVTAGSGSNTGGLIAVLSQAQASSPHSYWDIDTTGEGSSAQGHGVTTVVLQSALPTGFGPAWGITKGYSYPFLVNSGLSYASTLATTVNAGRIFTFLPLAQNEPTEYRTPPAHADAASLAAVYTMLGRAFGETHNDARLRQVKIDRYFWDDATQRAKWAGIIRQYATLGSAVPLAGAAIGDANIIGALKARNVVIIHGRYDLPGGGTAFHWMLATLFTSDSNNVTITLVANDPWTGQQVHIDPITRHVVQPANFPLANFHVDAYRVVTLN